MTRPALADVNVLLPLLMPQHSAHAAARGWMAAQTPGSFRYALPVQQGVLRLLSRAEVMGSSVLLPLQALKVWQDLVAFMAAQELHAQQPAHSQVLAGLVAGRVSTPNLWTDAWLAALAISTDCEMVTFDKGFRSFEGLSLRLLSGVRP